LREPSRRACGPAQRMPRAPPACWPPVDKVPAGLSESSHNLQSLFWQGQPAASALRPPQQLLTPPALLPANAVGSDVHNENGRLGHPRLAPAPGPTAPHSPLRITCRSICRPPPPSPPPLQPTNPCQAVPGAAIARTPLISQLGTGEQANMCSSFLEILRYLQALTPL
jgi:hypothetical protein